MTWQTYFNLIGIQPGRVKTSLAGTVDFSDPAIPLETVQALYESGLPYLELTPEGKKRFLPEAIAETPKRKASARSKA